MNVLWHRMLPLLAAACVAGVLLSGCGGDGVLPRSPSHGQPVDDPPGGDESASMTLTIAWPAPPEELTTRLVPQLSNHIRLTVVDVASGEILIEDTLHRPGSPPWVTEASYQLRASPGALLTATAYPEDPAENPDAVAQAQGSMHVIIPGGGIGYPADGGPGDPVIMVMDSAVVSVEVAGESLSLLIGTTLRLTPTAYDADRNMVLVAGFDWAAGNANATVDDEGLVTGIQIGECEITATEVESGVDGSATVEVVMPAISGTVSGLGGVPHEFVTVRVLNPDTGELVSLTRSRNDGTYRIPVPPQADYRVVAEKRGCIVYEPDPGVYDLRVENADVHGVDFTVVAPPLGPGMGEIRGFAYTSGGDPIEGVTVTAERQSIRTDRNGEFAFTLTAGLNYTVTAVLEGLSFTPGNQEVHLPGGVVHTDDFIGIAE